MSKLIFEGRHNSIWDAIFRNDSWTSVVRCHGLNPILLGRDLHSIYDMDAAGNQCVYILLMTGDKSGDIRSHSLIFMDSLKPHTYNKTTKEVLFTNSRVILNVHDAVSNVSTKFVDWRRLFSCPEESLRSAYLYQQDHHYALRPLRLEDATGAEVEISDVTIESLTLRLARKLPEELDKLGPKIYVGGSWMGDIPEETTPQKRESYLWWRVPMTSQPHRLPRIVEE